MSPASNSPKSSKGLNGLRANPATTPNGGSNVMEFVPPPPKPVSSKVPGSVPKSPGGKHIAPRDPTLHGDSSMRDFADFIRSTGPDTDPKNMYKPGGATTEQHSRNTSATLPAANTGKPLPKKITKQNAAVPVKQPEINKLTPQRSISKLKARDPQIGSNNATADLADFFRSGPPGAQVMDPPRQPPKQSPTGVNGISNGRMVSTGSFASTQDSFPNSKMTQSSTNSRTGLLDNRTGSVANNQQLRSPPPDVGGPARKQRRTKDPYAIDSEEEEDFSPPVLTDRGEEESLSDFLRNYTPPPESAATARSPVAAGVGQPPVVANQSKERKASGPSMRERLARNIAVIPDYRPLPPKAPKKTSTKSPPQSNEKRQNANLPQRPPSLRQTSSPSAPSPNSQLRSTTTTTNINNPSPTAAATINDRPGLTSSNSHGSGGGGATAPQLPPLNPRATSPHLTSQNGSKMDMYKPTRPTYAAHVDRRGGGLAKPQARDEMGAGGSGGGGGGIHSSGRSGMGDLAEFLRDTEPPSSSTGVGGGGGGGRGLAMGHSAAVTSMSPEPGRRKNGGISGGGGGGGGGGFGAMFGRKRKV